MLQHQFLTSKTYRMSSDSSIPFPTYLGALVESKMNALCNQILKGFFLYWPKIREEVLKISRRMLLIVIWLTPHSMALLSLGLT